jgi:UDP-4-amino-4,6-dideoxy-N-acetyl-beta-L-altrosamine transaminase
MIPYGRQDITEADLDAVRNVLLSDFITQGPATTTFEADLSRYCGVDHAVAVNSATAALHMACLALGLGQGDLLWTSPNTFVASSNVGLYCGADVDFIDIDPATYNMCVDTLEARLKEAKKEGRLPKIVIPVHFAGQSCDMERIAALRDTYGFSIIEDASHAIGGSYLGKPVGGCQYSDITVFSFHPVKIITTAEGGMAMTNDAELAARMQMLRSHGISRDPERMRGTSDGPWYYQQLMLGYNFRMTEMQATLGSSQLTRLDEYIDARHAILQRYNEELADLPITLPFQPANQRSSLHLYPILVNDDAPVDRATAFDALRAAGIGVNVLYIPVHRQPYYQDLGFKEGHCPKAENYYARTIALPMFAKLTPEDQGTVIAAVKSVFTAA